MYPPPRQRPLVEGGSTMMEPLQMRVRLQDWLHGGDQFPIAFMLWAICLRLLGNVSPTPQEN